MLKLVDRFLNNITMYKLVLYILIILLTAATLLSYAGVLAYNPLYIILSTLYLLAVSWLTNHIFARVFNAPANSESVYITALILALIITPLAPMTNLAFLTWVAVLAMSSKFIIARFRKHIFNPAALAVVLTSFALGQSASWWVGNPYLLPLTIVGGLLVVRKIQRFDMVWAFFFVVFAGTLAFSLTSGTDAIFSAKELLYHSPLFFFAFIMLTEPLTMPPTKLLQVIYGGLVGFLFIPVVHIANIYFTPEMALIAGNVFAYIFSMKKRLVLQLEEKIELASNTFEFVFASSDKFKFSPGQYLEWTLPHKHVDSRGNRRYFTIASSPAEDKVRAGVKFYDRSSSFKKTLISMRKGDKLLAGQLAGDFRLPKNTKQKLAFFAGGIGITPFRSMIQNQIDQGEKRDMVVMYQNNGITDIAYKDFFDAAEKYGVKTVYAITNPKSVIDDSFVRGRFDADVIKRELPDYRERLFYLSGPRSFVVAFEETLRSMGIKRGRIKTDFFPGFA